MSFPPGNSLSGNSSSSNNNPTSSNDIIAALLQAISSSSGQSHQSPQPTWPQQQSAPAQQSQWQQFQEPQQIPASTTTNGASFSLSNAPASDQLGTMGSSLAQQQQTQQLQQFNSQSVFGGAGIPQQQQTNTSIPSGTQQTTFQQQQNQNVNNQGHSIMQTFSPLQQQTSQALQQMLQNQHSIPTPSPALSSQQAPNLQNQGTVQSQPNWFLPIPAQQGFAANPTQASTIPAFQSQGFSQARQVPPQMQQQPVVQWQPNQQENGQHPAPSSAVVPQFASPQGFQNVQAQQASLAIPQNANDQSQNESDNLQSAVAALLLGSLQATQQPSQTQGALNQLLGATGSLVNNGQDNCTTQSPLPAQQLQELFMAIIASACQQTQSQSQPQQIPSQSAPLLQAVSNDTNANTHNMTALLGTLLSAMNSGVAASNSNQGVVATESKNSTQHQQQMVLPYQPNRPADPTANLQQVEMPSQSNSQQPNFLLKNQTQGPQSLLISRGDQNGSRPQRDLLRTLQEQRKEQDQMEAISARLRKQQAKSHRELQLKLQVEEESQEERQEAPLPPTKRNKTGHENQSANNVVSKGLMLLAQQVQTKQLSSLTESTNRAPGPYPDSSSSTEVLADNRQSVTPIQGELSAVNLSTLQNSGPPAYELHPAQFLQASSQQGNVPRYVTVLTSSANSERKLTTSSAITMPLQRTTRERGRPSVFPRKLLQMLLDLEELGMSDIASFLPHGRAFAIHKNKEFVNCVMPTYFNTNNFASFQRQMNNYGFQKVKEEGPEQGAYYHEFFIRNKPALSNKIKRKPGSRKTANSATSNEKTTFKTDTLSSVTASSQSDVNSCKGAITASITSSNDESNNSSKAS